MVSSSSLNTGVTVGEVAGLISGGISLLHIIIPLLWAFILVAAIRGGQFDAATWSSISHQLQSSWWPQLLQSDGAVGNFFGKVIKWRVFFLSQFVTFATICLVVANFLTPKPLTEVIRPSDDLHDAEFAYAPDSSYYGQAMLERQPIYRRCGWNLYMDCPNSIYDDAAVRNRYKNAIVVNSTIPQITRDIFGSGTRRGTIAGPLDLQYRDYVMMNLPTIDNNASRPVGRLENLPMLILEEKYHLVEGLIVDTIDGGIGIRNHTAPTGLELGATWKEDVLWIVPETKCTNTNLSLHFTVTANFSVSYGGDLGYLQDDGGFSNIPAVVPSPPWNTPELQWKHIDEVPDLKRRADILAWWNNQFTAWTMNLTASKLGNIYREQFNNYAHVSTTGAIKVSPMDGLFLDDLVYNRRQDLETKFKQYGYFCTGYWDDDPNVVGKSFVRCGYFFDVPQPENLASGQSWRSDPGSGWKQNLYTCASAVTATVKEVTFSANASATLKDMQVLEVRSKDYTSEDMPTWGIEKVDGGKYNISDIYKFWGLIDSSLTKESNVDAYRATKIYLPAAVRGLTIATKMYDNFAAGGAFTATWHSIYENAAISDSIAEVGIPNYSGKLDFGLTLKWRQLSQAGAAGAERVLNLIWTDLITRVVAGSNTGFENDTLNPSEMLKNATGLGLRQVHRYVRVIEYENILYAIPAFIAAGLFVLPLILCLFILCFQNGAWRALNHYMNQTNMGRASTQLLLRGKDGEIGTYAKTGQWAKWAKEVPLDVPDVPPHMVSEHGYELTEGLLRRRPIATAGEQAAGSHETLIGHSPARAHVWNRWQYEPVAPE